MRPLQTYEPLTQEQITDGNFDLQASMVDLEATRIAEEEGISYISALSEIGKRYANIEVTNNYGAYDNIVSVDQFRGEEDYSDTEED
jgi:hypothetical protein